MSFTCLLGCGSRITIFQHCLLTIGNFFDFFIMKRVNRVHHSDFSIRFTQIPFFDPLLGNDLDNSTVVED